ncbi:MAG: methyltransferase family protein [Flavobacteriales bacterium]
MKNIFLRALLYSLIDVAIVWAGILFYRCTPYYVNFLNDLTQDILLGLGVLYVFTSFPIQLYRIRHGQSSKAFVLVKGLYHLSGLCVSYLNRLLNSGRWDIPAFDKEEKTVILFYIVKFFYIPLMIDFACWNGIYLRNFIAYIPAPGNGQGLMLYFNKCIYPIIYSAAFFLNSVIYSFGYMFEFSFLKNKVRSVEPTVLGWVACIICYPPFSFWYARMFPSFANEMAFFINTEITFVVRLLVSAILIYMLYAVVVLGTKCSNLVNRGIVTTGPYKLIRHPHYMTKNLIWWITAMPAVIHKPLGILFLAVWSFTYYLRSITEEKHLMSDPDYVNYCKKVKYRFIPYLV